MKTYTYLKDKNYRFKYSNIEKKRNVWDYLMYNNELSFNKRIIFYSKFYRIRNKFTVNTKIKNRCIFSGRSRGVLSDFRVSRHFFKKFIKKGQFFNVIKNK